MSYLPCEIWETDFQQKTLLRRWSKSQGTRGNGIVFLQEQAVIVQNPAGAGGCEIKWKQSLLKPPSPLLTVWQNWTCAQTPDQHALVFVHRSKHRLPQWSVCCSSFHIHTYMHHSPLVWSAVKEHCPFLHRFLHLFRRRGDRSSWKSLVAAFTRDPLGQPRNTAAALIASCCAVLFVDVDLPALTHMEVNTARMCCMERTIMNAHHLKLIIIM